MTYGNIDIDSYHEMPQHARGTSTIIHLHKQDGPVLQDSIEIGTPGKGGAIKVYFNAGDVTDAKARVLNAMEVRKFTREQIEIAG